MASKIGHARKHLRAAGREQPIGVSGGAMAATAKADDRHAGGERGLDADRAVLDDNAILGRGTQLLRREQEEVGSRFAARDLRGAEDMRLEQRQ